MAHVDRNVAIETIKRNLERRSGLKWSVTGGRGTGYGWIRIDAPPKDRRFHFDGSEGGGCMSIERRETLAKLLGIANVHAQGESIPAGSDYRAEYIARSNGETPTVIGQQYWD